MSKFFVLLGPSGVGKGTLTALFKERHPEFYYPISWTTRPPRPGEQDNQQYHYVTEAEFLTGIAQNIFLEYAFIHQQQYSGLLKTPVIDALHAGQVVFREADLQGYKHIKAQLGSQAIGLFLVPPSLEILRQRIQLRSPLQPHELEHRLTSAAQELAEKSVADYEIITLDGQPEDAYQKLETIIYQECGRQKPN